MNIRAQLNLRSLAVVIALVLLAFGPNYVSATELKDIRVVASIFPPYSYDQNGRAEGVAVEVVRQTFAKLGLNPSIEVYPWARALRTAERTPNTLLFSVARTPERETWFKWIGTVIGFDVHIYKKSGRTDINIKTLEDLKGYTFAGLIRDVKTNYLTDLGAHVHEVSNEESAFRMLDLGRIDMVAADRHSAKFRMNKLGFKGGHFVSAYRLSNLSKPLYLVANINTDDQIIEQIRTALESLDLSN